MGRREKDRLKAIQIGKLGPGRHSDGNGLHLFVKPNGARSWVLRIVVNGKRRDLGLGSVDLVSLAEAREKARDWRKLARQGVDPSLEARRVIEIIPTFEKAATDYHAAIRKGWKNAKHGDQWLATLKAYAFPIIGKRRVDTVDVAAIHEVLAPIWLTVPETARRVRQRVGAVLDYAHGRGWRELEAPMRAVARGLPRQPRQSGHFAAMPYRDVPALMAKLETDETSIGRLALRFTILTAARSGEVRGATWGEIDLERAAWRIPGPRMKGGEDHAIPLSPPAVAILQELKGLLAPKPSDLVFPGLKGKPISDATMAKVLRVADVSGATVHGFRSSFRDWVAEATTYPGDWAEAALAHSLPNRVEAAYRRTKFFDQRRAMMEAWAIFLSGGSNVIQLQGARA